MSADDIDDLLGMLDYESQFEDVKVNTEKLFRQLMSEKGMERIALLTLVTIEGFPVVTVTRENIQLDEHFNLASAITVIHSTGTVTLRKSVNDKIKYSVINGEKYNIVIFPVTEEYVLGVVFYKVEVTKEFTKKIVELIKEVRKNLS